ncbi:DUF350 domain-containing protein [Fictibacillus aquaticus]|uniref:DUF350 domain-containing protein n=1 Tax=Fictibacillus aquaticus TaxID=2021314 RepID=A0A235F659_9BACL|nr:DUF350 domain-containing protein [Fictibacillus aquaticus]OYD56634.1 DUF350 domain-containing protein [Fictibacillus aquaticus]
MELVLNFLLYAATGLGLLMVGFVMFEMTTKVKELKLISKGNTAAALSIGGRLFGLAFVIGSSIANSVNIVDMLIWGAIGIVAQVIAFYIAEVLILRIKISKAVEENNVAVGVILLLLSLSVGWVIAQCLTY